MIPGQPATCAIGLSWQVPPETGGGPAGPGFHTKFQSDEDPGQIHWHFGFNGPKQSMHESEGFSILLTPRRAGIARSEAFPPQLDVSSITGFKRPHEYLVISAAVKRGYSESIRGLWRKQPVCLMVAVSLPRAKRAERLRLAVSFPLLPNGEGGYRCFDSHFTRVDTAFPINFSYATYCDKMMTIDAHRRDAAGSVGTLEG